MMCSDSKRLKLNPRFDICIYIMICNVHIKLYTVYIIYRKVNIMLYIYMHFSGVLKHHSKDKYNFVRF